MLFRAPGINKLNKRTTAIGIDETLIEKSIEGFDLAVNDMSANLDAELAHFKTRIKEEKIAKIENKDGSRNGGTFGFYLLVLMLSLILLRKKLD